MEISILTPSYNSMPFIEWNVESVVKQNLNNVEHIIMDGASNDGTIEFLESCKGIVWRSEKDSGQSEALNKAFKLSSGKIIGWLNSDDTYCKNTFKIVSDFFEKNANIDIIYSDVNIIDSNGRLRGISKANDFNLEEILYINMIKQPTVFMRRKVFEKLGSVNETLHYVMDREFWLRSGLMGFNFHYFQNKVFSNFRLHEGAKSFKYAPKFSHEWRNVLETTLEHKKFQYIGPLKRKELLIKNESEFYMAKMFQAIELRDKRKLFFYMRDAVRKNRKLLFNKGFWKYIIFGILGIRIDKFKKYKKK